MPVCPSCGKDNPEGFAFCGFCSAPLEGSRARGRAAEERKTVTVLFADLVGFTSTAEALDPEDVRRILSPYYAKLRTGLEHFGGTVEKFIGDAVMAVFGAPVAHEDDPERAVRAAISIRDALAEDEAPLRIRIAVNTGEALVTLGARPAEGEGMVAGDVVNTAARMQVAAPENGILVGEATYRATKEAIRYREAEPVQAKGKVEPVPVWEAVGARSRFGLDVDERPRTPLVGRKRELGFLVDAMERARSERSSQLVTLIGVPGIGKSRLVAELFQVVERDPDLILWRQGRSLPYGEGLSYRALGEIVKAQVGIVENDPEDVATTKLRDAVDAALPGSDEASWVEGHLRPLVGLASEGSVDSADPTESYPAWRRFFEGLAEQRPLVLVFEDLHWADDGLLDLVDHLADWATTVPLLIVCMARPELLDRRPGWGGGKRNSSIASIGALSREETAELLTDLLDRTLLPAEIQSVVLERAEGNPLYAEEYVRMLRDRGLLQRDAGGVWRLSRTEDPPLPETVQGMIAARMDALAHAEKELIQDAAVVGKVFWPGALGSLSSFGRSEIGTLLHSLDRKEFLRREPRSVVSGEQQFAFLHILVRDVAYAQIPRSARAEKHRLTAEWIDSLVTDRSEDRAEMLAHHYLEALKLLRASGDDPARLIQPAIAALDEAAERALALGSAAPALRLSEEALGLIAPNDPLNAKLLVRCLRAKWLIGDFDERLGERAVEAALANEDSELAAEAVAVLADATWIAGQHDEAMELSARSVELSEALSGSAVRARVRAHHARRVFLGWDHARGEELARAVLEETEGMGLDEVASHALNTVGMARCERGDPAGLEDLRKSIDIAWKIKAPHLIHAGYNNLGQMLWAFGRLDEGSECLRQARIADERFGSRDGLRWLDSVDVLDHWLRGDWLEALKKADEILSSVTGLRYQEMATRNVRRKIRLSRGDVEGALGESETMLRLAREIKDPQVVLPALLARAEVLLAAGRRSEVDAVLDELIANDSSRVGPMYLAGRSLILLQMNREADAKELLRGVIMPSPWTQAEVAIAEGRLADAARIYEEIGARAMAAGMWLAEGERAASEGRPDRAEPALRRALEFWRSVQADAYANRAESLLVASA